MSDPSERHSRLVDAKNQVFSKPYAPIKNETIEIDELLQQSKEHLDTLDLNSEVEENPKVAGSEQDDDIPHFSGNPFFDIVLAQSHVKPAYQLNLPRKMIEQLPPGATVPVTLRHGRRIWNMSYAGNCSTPKFDKWRRFVIDNDLKEEDGLVLELMECSEMKIEFKVHILRGDLPPELQAEVDSRGTSSNPITVQD